MSHITLEFSGSWECLKLTGTRSRNKQISRKAEMHRQFSWISLFYLGITENLSLVSSLIMSHLRALVFIQEEDKAWWELMLFNKAEQVQQDDDWSRAYPTLLSLLQDCFRKTACLKNMILVKNVSLTHYHITPLLTTTYKPCLVKMYFVL